MRVWKARTLWGRSRSLAVRHAVFCEGRGGETLETCPVNGRSRRFHDRYDAHSLFFGASIREHWYKFPRTIATARLVLGPRLPTAEVLPSLGNPLPLDSHRSYSEPSRVGLLQEYQATPAGAAALLGMLGILVNSSVRAGYEDSLLTMRWQFFSALNWLPFTIADPFLYPAEAGGPATTELIFPTVLNHHEVVAAAKIRQHPYQLMFGRDPSWFKPAKARTDRELSELMRSNQRFVRKWRADFKAGRAHPLAASLTG